jgi:hypothetical protein
MMSRTIKKIAAEKQLKFDINADPIVSLHYTFNNYFLKDFTVMKTPVILPCLW